MDTYIREQITNLRHTLHACPEISGQEKQTKETLQNFLKAHTSLELHDCGKGFYAAHRENTGNGIAFRADYDALALPEGGAAHLCGHDGHASALCGLALMLEGKTAGRDVFLLFQPAEETGAGAYPCTELFEKEQDGLGVEMEEQDVFPSTENDPGCAAKVMERCNGKPLEVPMRWSEDFGHYLKKCKGAFFGIGAGEDHAALHMIHYEYPDELLEHTAEVFLRLI